MRERKREEETKMEYTNMRKAAREKKKKIKQIKMGETKRDGAIESY